ncbi:MAG: S-layer homology domain-containing protein [Clostridiales bacterium]|nr:S-layer homology domain-containing protein [Clostridiales bacterium]
MKTSYFMKASAAALFSLAVTGMVFANVKAADEVKDKQFNDDVFREFVFTNFDTDGNGTLSEKELEAVKEINVSGLNIKSLSGIRHFTSLDKLDCSNTKVTKIDLNDNEALTTLNCSGCKLSTINIADCYALEEIDCSNNDLKEFAFSNGFLTKLDISNNKSLTKLDCSKNSLTSVNLEGCTALTDIDLTDNQLESLDLGTNTALKSIVFEKNSLKSLDLSKCISLETINVADNKLTALTVGTNDKLTKIIANDNLLKTVDLSNTKNLTSFECNRNALKSIDISNCPDLAVLEVDDNKISSLNISNNQTLLMTYTTGDLEDVEGTITYVLKKDGVESRLSYDPEVKIVLKGALLIDKTEDTIVCGESDTLKATLKGVTSKITWKSSDKKVASVDSNGKVTAKMAGTAKITASAAGKTVSCDVTVLYKDVSNAKDFWFNPTNYLTAKNVVKGYADQTEFRPANECSRAQMVTFLWRLAGSPAPKAKTTSFKDVKSTDYFFKPVIWAVEQGITTGVSKTKFNPSGICTRAQTVTFLWRMAGKPAPKADKCKFKDVKAKDYFYKATIWASEKKIVAGYDDGTFKPEGKCLRRQMVTFLYKYDKNIK